MGANKLDIEFEDDVDTSEKEKTENNQIASVEEINLEFEIPSNLEVSKEAPSSSEKEEGILRIKKDTSNRETPASEKEYRLGDEIKELSSINKLLAAEIEAKVQIEVQKIITTKLAQETGERKVLEYRINKVLAQVGQKAPSVKKELVAIKKMLIEFNKRKES